MYCCLKSINHVAVCSRPKTNIYSYLQQTHNNKEVTSCDEDSVFANTAGNPEQLQRRSEHTESTEEHMKTMNHCNWAKSLQTPSEGTNNLLFYLHVYRVLCTTQRESVKLQSHVAPSWNYIRICYITWVTKVYCMEVIILPLKKTGAKQRLVV